MKKKRSVSSVQGKRTSIDKFQANPAPLGKRAAKSARPMPDSRLDFDDIPESTDEELKRARRVGRPTKSDAKLLIALRLHPKLLAKLKALAGRRSKPYQTFIHELLEKAVKKAA